MLVEIIDRKLFDRGEFKNYELILEIKLISCIAGGSRPDRQIALPALPQDIRPLLGQGLQLVHGGVLHTAPADPRDQGGQVQEVRAQVSHRGHGQVSR